MKRGKAGNYTPEQEREILANWRNARGDRRGINRVLYGVPLALALSQKPYHFKPGRPGRRLCEGLKRNGQPCQQLAMTGQRACRFHNPFAWAFRRGAKRAKAKAGKAAPGPAPDLELAAHPAWAAAQGQRERNALAQAWASRETSPGAWRSCVRAILARTGQQDDGNAR